MSRVRLVYEAYGGECLHNEDTERREVIALRATPSLDLHRQCEWGSNSADTVTSIVAQLISRTAVVPL